MKQAILKGQQLCKTFPDGNEILQSVDVEIYDRDFTIIMGASGAGKSTLLYALSGMDKVTGGKVFYQQTHLVSNLTLFENVAVAGYIGKTGTPKEIQEKARQLLRQMKVENAKDRLPANVSGGEAQRAAIARAMIGSPGLLFADEPTGALNRSNTEEVLDLLTALNRNGQSILMVTHDMRAAVRGNRLLYLEDGKLLDQLSLPPYEEAEIKQREAMVSQWLSNLQW